METKDLHLGAAERRFAEIVWANAPVTTRQLVALCAEALDWKRTTTYTVLKRLCERGLFETTDGVVTAKVTQHEFDTAQSEQFVSERFGGSLPAFVAAFTAGKKLKPEEVAELRALIDAME